MRTPAFLWGSAPLALLLVMRVSAQERRVAITVDDLPYARGSMPTANEAEARAAAKSANAKLLAAFQAHHVPVTGFVIQKSVESLGPPAGAGILQEWIADGFDLGNHTYSHRDLNGLSPEQMEQEILEGESTIRPLMERAGKRIAFLRFPFNHTGDTKLKHDAVAAFLGQHGYRVATCTIDTSDYDFNNAYVRMLANSDKASARKLREEYLAYTSTEIDYYAALNKQVLGYDPPEVMLLHDNRLNADTIGEVLRLFEEKGYRFVSLEAAQSDAAYHIPETYITKFGPMWGYRWARERNVKVNGSLEPDPPKWISDYGKAGTR